MDIIDKAVSVLMHDGIIIYPTETIYGLGADAFSDEAILKVYEVKERPLTLPISIAVSDFDMLTLYVPRGYSGPIGIFVSDGIDPSAAD